MRHFDLNSFLRICRSLLVLTSFIIPQVVQAQWHATVGTQSEDLAKQVIAFLPNEMWIHVGDSITWTFLTDEPHTVSFLKNGQVRPPDQAGCPGFASGSATFDGTTCVSTSRLKKGEIFTVTFPAAGNFKLVCLIHRNMTGTVRVLGLNEPLPHDQDFYDKEAQNERERLLSAIDLGSHDEHSIQNHVDAGVGVISATPGGNANLAVMRFDHEKIFIGAGETVEWSNSDPTASHTITFGIEPADPMPPSFNVTVDADGARHAVISSTADNVHSGFIVAAAQERVGLAQLPSGVTRFRVTFKSPGTYPYICALHDELGMQGTVVVLPQ
ncbi:MAG TPA: plastocyanin/azurin family copper-binding protein [Candidatus Acidoferrum sp.]|nr:plastocyanin/azurin family copper-binding protein [Candidatus Acidoferrum sp.]